MTTRSELARGTRLGKYEIHGRLSVGGMAELYLASLAGQGGFRKFVALKRVLPSIAENQDFKSMFLDEARITASLSHAGIAQVFELAEDPETHEPMLAMEFVAGQNLEQIVQRARKRNVPLPPEFVARIGTDVLLALHYAHGFHEPATGQAMPVVHRDINPRNVMITYSGGIKIIDFGIAKARGRLNQTSAGFVKGTLQYMAPEQVTARGVDGRSDLFAASIILFELLSGRILFDAPSPAAVMSKVMHDPLPDLGELVPSLPGDLVDAVMKGLERDPDQRWQTGREYARAIDRALNDSFDEQQMAEVMESLFEDKIAVTRALLSNSEHANTSDLRLMTMMGEEESPRELASDIVAKKEATAIARTPGRKPTHEQLAANERTEMNLQPVKEKPAPPAKQPFAESERTINVVPTVSEPPSESEKTLAGVMPVTSKRPSESEKTVAGIPPLSGKPRSESEKTIAGLVPAPLRKPKTNTDLWLYVVLAVLALALVIGAVVLFSN